MSCPVFVVLAFEGIRAPLSASLVCRRERNRSHDDEFHRRALEYSCCSYLAAGNTNQPAEAKKIFAVGKRCGADGSEFWLQGTRRMFHFLTTVS
jgi:hypothetical protein